jgi:uncharacterized membrane protein
MWTRQLLKENAKVAFRRNYWTCVLVSILAGFLGVTTVGGSVNFDFSQESSGTSGDVSQMISGGIPDYLVYALGGAVLIAFVIGICFSLLVTNVVKVGCNRYFLENREHKTDVSQLFYGFKQGRYGSNVWVMFLHDLYIFGWSLLLIVPGIIKTYQYALVPYILAENEDLDKDRIFKMSKEMMDGHKMELFVLELSFIGWALLGTLSLGMVGIFWTNPYMNATMAEFYSAVKAESLQNGTVLPHELPGVSPMQDVNMDMNMGM